MQKRGTRSLPSEKVTLSTSATVVAPLHTHNNKKYLELRMNRSAVGVIRGAHDAVKDALVTPKVQNPLTGDVLRVKVPWKGRNHTCTVTGNKALCGLVEGDKVKVEVDFCGAWIVGDFSGTSWKLISLEG
tara:strand:+ start:430 stop:819 length:390 start_codon:yes stop_codon:yes gene_type:complete